MQSKGNFVLLLIGLVLSQVLATGKKVQPLDVQDLRSEDDGDKERLKKSLVCMDIKDNLGTMNLLPQSQTLNMQSGTTGLQTFSIQGAVNPIQALSIPAAAKPIQTLNIQPALQPVQTLNIQSSAQPVQTLSIQPALQPIQTLNLQPAAQSLQTFSLQPAVQSVPFVNLIQTQHATPQISIITQEETPFNTVEEPQDSQDKPHTAYNSKSTATAVETIEKPKVNMEKLQYADRSPTIPMRSEFGHFYSEQMIVPLVKPCESVAAYVSPSEVPPCHQCHQPMIKCRCSQRAIGNARAADIVMDQPMRYLEFREPTRFNML